MSAKRLSTFEDELTDDERQNLAEIVAQIADPAADLRALQPTFFAFALPVLQRLGGGHPGPLWGELLKQHRVGKRDPVKVPFPELAASLPYPLGFKLKALLRAESNLDEGVDEPQFAFELCAVMGVLVRLAALISIQDYVTSDRNDSALNHAVMAALQRPADGTWLDLAGRLTKALKSSKLPFASRVGEALRAKVSVSKPTAQAAGTKSPRQALDALVAFRNDLVHGEPITEARLKTARAQLRVAVRGFAWLAEYRLEVLHHGTVWSLNGDVPRPVESEADLPDDEPCLVRRSDPTERMSLSPLLRFRSGEGEDDHRVELDEVFFLNAGSAERLSYIGYRDAQQLDGRALGSWEAFKAFMAKVPTPPIPRDPKLDFTGLTAFHSRLFVGRRALLEEIAERIAAGDSQYLVLRALAGMGKTAVLASLAQAAANLASPESAVPSAADGLVRDGDLWAVHFCMPTDGRNSPTVALRSLIAQICDHFGEKRDPWLSQDLDKLKDELFPALLARVGPQLSDGRRLVIAVDALDEGIGAEKESVPSCMPAGTYENVVFLLSWRVDTDHSNSRVDDQLRHIAAERRAPLTHASPLMGLAAADVDAYLERLSALGGPAPAEATRTAVWAAATADAVDGSTEGADPFYLRFLADGVQQQSVRLDRAETVPESLDDAFEQMWMGLPTDRDFLCHRVLLTLGIMREYGEDELFSELFNRERSEADRLTPTDIAAVRVKAGKLLVYDGDRYGLFHDRFRVFLVGEQKDPIAEALGME